MFTHSTFHLPDTIKNEAHQNKMPVKEIVQQKVQAVTWIDTDSGLEWQCESPGRMNWHEAQSYAQTLSISGKDNWRLPTASELETLLDRTILLDRTEYRPAMREEVPFRDSLSYWSSTTFGPNKKNAWIVMFDGAYVLSYYKTNEYHVRCVRGK